MNYKKKLIENHKIIMENLSVIKELIIELYFFEYDKKMKKELAREILENIENITEISGMNYLNFPTERKISKKGEK